MSRASAGKSDVIDVTDQFVSNFPGAVHDSQKVGIQASVYQDLFSKNRREWR
jgi:hypothetical protein